MISMKKNNSRSIGTHLLLTLKLNIMLTVGEVRKSLEGMPDSMPFTTLDKNDSTKELFLEKIEEHIVENQSVLLLTFEEK